MYLWPVNLKHRCRALIFGVEMETSVIDGSLDLWGLCAPLDGQCQG